MMCASETDSSFSSISDNGKIFDIIIGSILCLAFLICVIVIIYLVYCKRKPKAQVWAQPAPRFQGYGQSMPMFPYTNYLQGHIHPSQTDPQGTIEELPPAYEEIATIEDSNNKI
jgi:hypothetical protein